MRKKDFAVDLRELVVSMGVDTQLALLQFLLEDCMVQIYVDDSELQKWMGLKKEVMDVVAENAG